MHRRSSVPYRPANIDQLFNINNGHQQPQHNPPSQHSASSTAVATSSASTDNDAEQYGNTTSGTAATGDEFHALGSTQASPVHYLLTHPQELHSNGKIVSRQGSTRAASASHASLTDASAPHSYESSAGSASLNQAELSSGSCAESATSASLRSVELSDAVQEFLAKPVSGPYRPIFFDLETTGMRLSAVGLHASRCKFSLMLLAVLTELPHTIR